MTSSAAARSTGPAPEPGPAAVPGGRETTEAIHTGLRRRILSGDIPAGAELAQAVVAKDHRVSRGPVREAFRLLQREGLLEVEVNQRARVPPLSVAEVEHLYALRIATETLAFGLSVARFTEAEVDGLERLAAEVAAAGSDDFEEWEQHHQRFHTALVAPAGPRMLGSIRLWAEHTGRYRRIYVHRDGWTLGAREHAALARLCRERDAAGAALLLTRHLSRAALALIGSMDPAHEPALLRAAIRQAIAAAGGAAH
jgi:DNA-binding GntR family transcriptional regulator